ncbi:MAG: hypothetical protein QF380_05935 [Candidatus Marinimicrobia bacterium]|jgi:hypothetical protein|nr:hypothetical protein [Candidatus Neomarinimicrobiota bacterium]
MSAVLFTNEIYAKQDRKEESENGYKKAAELTEGFKSGEGLSSPLQSLTYMG